MPRATWLALIADLRASRSIPKSDRQGIDKALLSAAKQTVRRRSSSVRLGPEILKGDELQLVFAPEAPCLLIAIELRGRLRVLTRGRADLRIGLGSGPIDRLDRRGRPFSSDGPAFHLARAAIEHTWSMAGARRIAWRQGHDGVDSVIDPVLGLVDAITARWTLAQWEAVIGRLEDKSLDAIARNHAVSFQSVSKRLLAASWREVEATLFTLQRLNSSNSTLKG